MKKLLFLLLLIPVITLSQDPSDVDSLLNELKQTNVDSTRVNLLNSIGFYMINVNLAEAEKYIQEAFELAKKNDYMKGLAESHNHLAIVAAYRGQKEEAFFNYFESLRIDSLISNLSGMARNYNNLGLTFDYLGDNEKAKKYLLRSIELYNSIKDTASLSKPYTNLALVYDDMGWFSLALDYHLKSLEIDKKYDQPSGVAGSLINMGNIYLQQGKLQKSYDSHLEALTVSENVDHLQYQTLALSGLASTLKERREFSKALEYQLRGLAIAEKMGKKYQLDDDHYILGQLYYELKDEENASKHFNQALRISNEMGNNGGVAKVEMALADISFNNGRYREALAKYDTARVYAFNSGEGISLRQAYKGLSRVYQTIGNLNGALKYLDLYTSLNDSLIKETNSRQLAELQTVYETNEKDQEIILQKSQLVSQQAIIQQQSFQRNLLIIGIGSLIVISVLLLYTYNNRLRVKELINKNQQENEQLRSRFFANISHEFRTPLTLLIARIEDLITESKKEQKADLFSMKKNTLRLLQLVNQLLDLSRIDAGRMPLRVGYGNISGFVKALIESFHSLALQKDISFQLEVDDTTIEGYYDPDHLEKIIVNLVSNAFKNTVEGGEISVTLKSSGSGQIQIIVKDNGSGIAEEDISRIFDRFHQASDSDGSGSGVGLSLTKELAELYRGTIEVKSKPGLGATFSVLLPIDKGTMQKLGARISETLSEPTEQGSQPVSITIERQTEKPTLFFHEEKSTALVVEDSPELRKYIVEFLSDDYQVITAPNGKAGLELAIKHQPDIILSDVMMPEMDGTELCKRVKNTPETSHIPFIMLTAKASGEDKLEGLDYGADDYLTKPFDKKELRVRMKNLIVQRQKLMEKFSRSLNPRDIKLNSADQKFMSQVGSIILEHLSDDSFSVEAFSKTIGMSRTQLFKKIKSLTGMSVSEYIRAIRLNRAAEMLKNKTASVSEIAYQVGFNNLSYFAKCFKERFAVSPSDYPVKTEQMENP